MSTSTTEESMTTGVVIDKEDNKINSNNNTEVEKQQENNKEGGQGDIGVGNPPRASNNNLHVEGKETDKKEQQVPTISVAPPATPPPTLPIESNPPVTPTTLDDTNDEIDLEAMRINSPTPIKDNSGDGLEEEEESPFPKRTSVFSGREHEDTDDFLLSTMLAIRTAVLAGTKDATNVDARPEDFTATRKHKISMAGDRKVEVKDYAPVVFTLLRRKFGISIPAYLLSWSDSRIAKSRSVGKSDSMFIHSPDNKFILKTLGRSEAKRLCKILPQYYILIYYQHLTTNKDTFLSRIYGLHRMSRRRGQSNVYFAIFNNVFDSGQQLSEIYDLKGSTVGRKAMITEPTTQRRSSTSFEFSQGRHVRRMTATEDQQPKKLTVLKDLDFTRQLHVGPENRSKVLNQLAVDCKFLSQHLLMDYSLLIGVRRTDTVPTDAPSVNDSPVISRNATPGSSPDLRVPGLLFFLESTKAASTKSIRETKKDRRKSITAPGSARTLLSGEDLSAIDEDEGEEEAEAEGTVPKGTTPPPVSAPVASDPNDESNPPSLSSSITGSAPTGSTPPIVVEPNNDSKINTNITTEDEEDVPVAPIKVTSSPVPQRKEKQQKEEEGNSGEVGSQPIPILKFSFTSPSTPNTTTTDNGTVHNEANGNSVDDSEDSTMESDSDSPRGGSSLGLVTVNSVPNFSYYGTATTNGGSAPNSSIPRTGSGLRYHSANNSPMVAKRPGRSASLNYVNLDPLCEAPFVPFHKIDEGGMKGNTFLALDAKKSTEVYFIGVIDFLQKYNKKKKLAGFAKSFKYEKEELSTVDPVFYMERFLKMAEKAVAE